MNFSAILATLSSILPIDKITEFFQGLMQNDVVSGIVSTISGIIGK